MGIFTNEFVNTVVAITTEHCERSEALKAEGQSGSAVCVTREAVMGDVSEQVGCECDPSLWNALHVAGILPGFQIKRGQYGGISRVDAPDYSKVRAERRKAEKAAATAAAKVEALKAKIAELTGEGDSEPSEES